MKRSIFFAIILVVTLTATMMMPSKAKAQVGGQLFGSTQDLYFENPTDNSLTGVEVMVCKGWLGLEHISLEVTVISVNGIFRDHGTREVFLSDEDVVVLGTEKAQANIYFDWDDIDPTNGNITYTSCVQVLANGIPIGDPICSTFDY